MDVQVYYQPWQHWIADNFLSNNALAELKQIEHYNYQVVPGKRIGSSNRLLIDSNSPYPHLAELYNSLKHGEYMRMFQSYTGIDYSTLYPRVEVISDIGPYFFPNHTDHLEKRLSALVYTDYTQLYHGTVLTDLNNEKVIEAKDNRCMFFVPATNTYHNYPPTTFNTVRRGLMINYWTYQ